MKKLTTFAISAVALTGIAAADVDASFNTGLHSDYIFRGGDLGDDNDYADFGLDFSGSCDCGLDWYAGIWYAAVDGTAGAADELDIYAGVSKDLGFGSVELGYITYTYLGDTGNTGNDAEVYLGLSTSWYGVDFGITSYFGTEGAPNGGTWIDLSASRELAYGIGLELGLGFAFGGATGDVDGLATYTATLSYDYAISDDITLSPYLSYSLNTEDYDASEEDYLFGGASLSFAF